MCCPTLCSGRENSRVVLMRFLKLKVVKTKKSGPRKRLEDGKLCFPRFLGPRRVGESDWVVGSRTSCDGPPPFSLLAALLFRESPHQVNRVLDPGQLRFTICRFFLFRQAFIKEEK